MFPPDRPVQLQSIESSSPDSLDTNWYAGFSQHVNLVPAAWDFERALRFRPVIGKQLVEGFLTETHGLASLCRASQSLGQLRNSRNCAAGKIANCRSEEHTSELQSHSDLV